MKAYNWQKIGLMAFTIAANILAAVCFAFVTFLFTTFINLDLIESDYYTETTKDKVQAVLKSSVVGSLFLSLFVSVASIFNWQVCESLASNRELAISWTVYLGLIPTTAILLVTVFAILPVFQ